MEDARDPAPDRSDRTSTSQRSKPASAETIVRFPETAPYVYTEASLRASRRPGRLRRAQRSPVESEVQNSDEILQATILARTVAAVIELTRLGTLVPRIPVERIRVLRLYITRVDVF